MIKSTNNILMSTNCNQTVPGKEEEKIDMARKEESTKKVEINENTKDNRKSKTTEPYFDPKEWITEDGENLYTWFKRNATGL